MRPPQWALRLYAGYMATRTRQAAKAPGATQAALLARILGLYARTDVGRTLRLETIDGPAAFRDRVPVTEESFYRPFFERVLKENPAGVVVSGHLQYMARTSGTSQASKHVPYTPPLIAAFKRFETQVAMSAMRDLDNYALLAGKLLITSGSPVCDVTPQGLTVGFGSGIMASLAPAMAKDLVRPTRAVLELADWQAKVDATVKEAFPLDIRVMTGVPIFVIPILERLLAYAREQGRPVSNAGELWPNLAVYYWSGSPIGLYEERLRRLFGPRVKFREIYACTEASIAHQHRDGDPGLLLDLEHTYFEFQPADAPLSSPRLGVEEVALGVPYRVLITTLGGLYAYRLGDTVEFVSLQPPMIRILGREQEELSLGFERVPIRQIRAALAIALEQTGAAMRNFFVAPTIDSEGERRAYHWYVEFERPPADLAAFGPLLDAHLIAHQPVYAGMRTGDAVLAPPVVTALPAGTIERYVLANRQFGQGKFLHLYNRREVPDQIVAHAPN